MVDGLTTAVPLGQRLPGVLQEDELLMRFVSGLDDVLAPVFTSLDSVAAYVDPRLAPTDFVNWLAGWVAVDVDLAWALARRRAVVAGATALHGRRGTAAGVLEALRLVVDGEVEIADSGGTSWSQTNDAPLPGEPSLHLEVRVYVDDPAVVDPGRLSQVVAGVKPANVPHEVRILTRSAPTPPGESDEGGAA